MVGDADLSAPALRPSAGRKASFPESVKQFSDQKPTRTLDGRPARPKASIKISSVHQRKKTRSALRAKYGPLKFVRVEVTSVIR